MQDALEKRKKSLAQREAALDGGMKGLVQRFGALGQEKEALKQREDALRVKTSICAGVSPWCGAGSPEELKEHISDIYSRAKMMKDTAHVWHMGFRPLPNTLIEHLGRAKDVMGA